MKQQFEHFHHIVAERVIEITLYFQKLCFGFVGKRVAEILAYRFAAIAYYFVNKHIQYVA